MKYRSVIAVALVLVMLLGTTAYAQATPASSPTMKEKAGEAMTWIGEGVDWIKNAYNTGKDAVVNSAEWIKQMMPEWSETVQSFINEKINAPEVQEAWNTLQEGAENAGNVSKEAVTEAYQTIREWMQSTGETVDQEVASALDQMAGAAGVEEAQTANWFRTVEIFVVANAEKVTEEVQKAWETIKQANLGDGKTPEETVTKAYETIREWMESFGTEDADTAEEALDHIIEETEE